ncbi:hypothetical protein [Frigidibacter sp. MR17.24]|uniref:hypothetical protein n=1 Tax=Frigidibacter sp. MR17.24 TaxID=3127345 RepID=UPI0030129F0F
MTLATLDGLDHRPTVLTPAFPREGHAVGGTRRERPGADRFRAPPMQRPALRQRGPEAPAPVRDGRGLPRRTVPGARARGAECGLAEGGGGAPGPTRGVRCGEACRLCRLSPAIGGIVRVGLRWQGHAIAPDGGLLPDVCGTAGTGHCCPGRALTLTAMTRAMRGAGLGPDWPLPVSVPARPRWPVLLLGIRRR